MVAPSSDTTLSARRSTVQRVRRSRSMRPPKRRTASRLSPRATGRTERVAPGCKVSQALRSSGGHFAGTEANLRSLHLAPFVLLAACAAPQDPPDEPSDPTVPSDTDDDPPPVFETGTTGATGGTGHTATTADTGAVDC